MKGNSSQTITYTGWRFFGEVVALCSPFLLNISPQGVLVGGILENILITIFVFVCLLSMRLLTSIRFKKENPLWKRFCWNLGVIGLAFLLLGFVSMIRIRIPDTMFSIFVIALGLSALTDFLFRSAIREWGFVSHLSAIALLSITGLSIFFQQVHDESIIPAIALGCVLTSIPLGKEILHIQISYLNAKSKKKLEEYQKTIKPLTGLYRFLLIAGPALILVMSYLDVLPAFYGIVIFLLMPAIPFLQELEKVPQNSGEYSTQLERNLFLYPLLFIVLVGLIGIYTGGH